jgi:hypothetical protein
VLTHSPGALTPLILGLDFRALDSDRLTTVNPFEFLHV